MESENKKPWYEDKALRAQIRWYTFFGGAGAIAVSFLLHSKELTGVGLVALAVAFILWLGSL